MNDEERIAKARQMPPFVHEHPEVPYDCPDCGLTMMAASDPCELCDQAATLFFSMNQEALIVVGVDSVDLNIQQMEKHELKRVLQNRMVLSLSPAQARELGRRLMLAADAVKGEENAG